MYLNVSQRLFRMYFYSEIFLRYVSQRISRCLPLFLQGVHFVLHSWFYWVLGGFRGSFRKSFKRASSLTNKSNAEFLTVQRCRHKSGKCHHKSGRCICEIKRGVKKGFKRWFCLGYCQRSVLLTFFNFKTGFRVLVRVLFRVLPKVGFIDFFWF